MQIEYVKVSGYTAFKILMLGYFLAATALFLSLHNFSFGPFQIFGQETLKFPYVWQNVAFIGKFLNLGLGIVMILLIGNEFSFGTAKQNLIDGLSRTQLVISKYLLLLVIAFGATAFMFFVALIMGWANSVTSTSALIFMNSGFMLSYLLHAIGLMSMAAFIAYLFRKTAIATMFFLAYAVFMEAILRMSIDADFTRYFPSKTLSNLISTPYADLVSGMDLQLQSEAWNEYMLIAVLYAHLFFLLSVRIVKRRSL